MKQLLKILSVGILLVCAAKQADAQEIDSLVRQARNEKNDALRLGLFSEITNYYWSHRGKDGSQYLYNYSDSIIPLARKLNAEIPLIIALRNKGMAMLSLHKLEQSILFLDSSIAVAKRSHLDESMKNMLMGTAEQGKNHAFIAMGKISLQIDALYNGIANFENTKEMTIGWYRACYYHLGNAYFRLNNYDRAIEAFERALEIAKKDTNQDLKANGFIYERLVKLYLEKGDFTKAKSYWELMKFRATTHVYDSISSNYAGGCYYYALQRVDSCLFYFSKMQSLVNKYHLRREPELLQAISRAYILKGDFITARKYLDSINKSDDFTYQPYESLGTTSLNLLYAIKTSNTKQAAFFFDSLERQTRHLRETEALSQMQSKEVALNMAKYQSDEALKKQKQELEYQQEGKRKNYVLFGSTIVLLLLVLLAVTQFRSRKKIQQEKDRTEDLLLNILPAEVAEELKAKGTADAKHFDNVTVLFTDFKSFTTVSEQLSPQELVNELHACFKGFDEICGKYSIEKIKTIGDAYLAVCGLPLADEKHAENVVNAALEIREFMAKRSRELGEKTFEIRIGINSGSVVAGIVGVKKFAYDIWGDTVNTAARMEQHSEAGKINISETTYDLVKYRFTCEYRGEIDAKNKGELKMYFVENV
jgi:class 3 adenylate cyclase